jgi:parallel beta-helix repeat protein
MSVFILSFVFLLGIVSISTVSKADPIAIYVRADGSIDPATSPISTLDNITYTLTDDINSSLYIERNNITFDGNGHTVMGQYSVVPRITGYLGLYCQNIANITVTNTTINSLVYLTSCSGTLFSENNITAGIHFDTCNTSEVSDNRISGSAYIESISVDISTHNNFSRNNVTGYGIGLHSSWYNNIYENNLNNSLGIVLYYSSYNTIIGNTLTYISNTFIGFSSSLNNLVYHNNFINGGGVSIVDSGPPHGNNTWDNGYPSGGNYWAGYNVTAMNATEIDSSGIWSKPYEMVPGNIDNYPLMGQFESFNVSTEEIDAISNFTISDLGLYEWLTTPNQYLQAGQLFLRLVPVQGQNVTTGFCRMTLPNNILNTSDYIVLADMNSVNVTKLVGSNSTHTILSFTFNTSTIEEVKIVPEFPPYLIPPLFFITTLLGVIVYRKRLTIC